MLSTAPADACASRHFKPEESELKLSIRLGDWWRNVSSNATSFAPDISLGGRRGREHKLIADATSDEYFDTTVEVSSAHRQYICVVLIAILPGLTRVKERQRCLQRLRYRLYPSPGCVADSGRMVPTPARALRPAHRVVGLLRRSRPNDAGGRVLFDPQLALSDRWRRIPRKQDAGGR